MDYAQALAEGLVRRPTNFISTICDESSDVHTYCGVPIDEVIERKLGIGGVIGLLWFKKEIPAYARVPRDRYPDHRQPGRGHGGRA